VNNITQLPLQRRLHVPASWSVPSKLDFTVVEREMSWRDNRGNYYEDTQSKKLVRVGDNGQPIPLATVNQSYTIVQNRELFDAVENNMVDAFGSDSLVGATRTDHIAYNGGTCYRDYVFPEIHAFVGESRVNFRMVVINSFGQTSIKMHAGAIDMFCTNGMIIGSFESMVKKHTSGVSVANFGKHARRSADAFVNMSDLFLKYAGKKISAEQAEAFVKRCVELNRISKRLGERLIVQFKIEAADRGLSLWSRYSAFTYWASHSDESRGFGTRNTEQDHESATMLKREETVKNLIPFFNEELESVA
jgi:hypothetical protein